MMSRWWRVLAVGAAVGLSATGCGGSDAPPAASAMPTASAPAAQAAAFQNALDRFVIERAVARTERAEAAAKFNAVPLTEKDGDSEDGEDESVGGERVALMEAVRAACAKLRELYTGFGSALRGMTFDEVAKTDVDGVLSATDELAENLAKYAEATAPEQFAAINSEELVSTAVWEESVRGLAATLGAAGLPTPTAAPTSAPSASPSGSPSGPPSDSASPSPTEASPTEDPSESPNP